MFRSIDTWCDLLLQVRLACLMDKIVDQKRRGQHVLATYSFAVVLCIRNESAAAVITERKTCYSETVSLGLSKSETVTVDLKLLLFVGGIVNLGVGTYKKNSAKIRFKGQPRTSVSQKLLQSCHWVTCSSSLKVTPIHLILSKKRLYHGRTSITTTTNSACASTPRISSHQCRTPSSTESKSV